MRLSTRTRYGVRFMFELARHYGQGSLLLKYIADTQRISEKYLSNLAIPLKTAGLINTARGSHGGYKLAKAPSLITVREIYSVLENDSAIIECIDKKESCPVNANCPTMHMWVSLQNQIDNFMNNITLQDLVDNYDSKINAEEFIYNI